MGSTKAVKSVDTNILVRIIAEGESAQAIIARTVIAAGVYVPLTVLLELCWTLRSRYDFDRMQLNAAVIGLLDSLEIHVDDEPAIRAALDFHAKGADIADVLHLVAAKGTEAFVTFDKGVPNATDMGVEVEQV